MKVTIEETLQAGTVDTALVTSPTLIYSEILEGARRPLVFLQVAKENFDLIGQMGTEIQFLKATQLGATESTEAYITGQGMASADKTISAVDINVPYAIWSAVQLSDFLKENFPRIDWIRTHLRNMASAVLEFLDALAYASLAGCSTVTASGATLSHTIVTNALAAMENNNWVAGGNITPFLIVAPETAADLLQDTTFTTTERYTTYDIARMVQGELGKYAGCRVLKSSYLDGKDYCFVVFPPDTQYGPVLVVAWKRRLTVKNKYFAKYGYMYFVTSIRANTGVVQAQGVCRIQLTTTP